MMTAPPCGFLNVHKPPGLTSREVVNHVQRLRRKLKTGHAGTLDPLATGVLVVAVGPATRLIGDVQNGRKTYVGTFRLGLRSDTDDITGRLTTTEPAVEVRREQLAALLPAFVGEIAQRPPAFSAVHVDGQRAYDLARKGVEVELSERPVTVHRLELVDFTPPDFTLFVECGSGTYIRSIGRDLGERLGCGAVMTALERQSVGAFTLDTACTLADLTPDRWEEFLLPPQQGLPELPGVTLDAAQVAAVQQGKGLTAAGGPWPDGRIVLLAPDGRMIGVGERDDVSGRLQPKLMFPPSDE